MKRSNVVYLLFVEKVNNVARHVIFWFQVTQWNSSLVLALNINNYESYDAVIVAITYLNLFI